VKKLAEVGEARKLLQEAGIINATLIAILPDNNLLSARLCHHYASRIFFKKGGEVKIGEGIEINSNHPNTGFAIVTINGKQYIFQF